MPPEVTPSEVTPPEVTPQEAVGGAVGGRTKRTTVVGRQTFAREIGQLVKEGRGLADPSFQFFWEVPNFSSDFL